MRMEDIRRGWVVIALVSVTVQFVDLHHRYLFLGGGLLIKILKRTANFEGKDLTPGSFDSVFCLSAYLPEYLWQNTPTSTLLCGPVPCLNFIRKIPIIFHR